MAPLAEMFLEFRKSLHDELDNTFLLGSQRILTEILEANQVELHTIRVQLENIQNQLAGIISPIAPVAAAVAANSIPEFYSTTVELKNIVERAQAVVETVVDTTEGEVVDEDTVKEEDEGEAEEDPSIEVDGITYSYNSAGDVYIGDSTNVLGKYDEVSGEFELFGQEEGLEEFVHKGKTYYKDVDGYLYNAEGESLGYIFTNGKIKKITTV